MKSRQIFSFIKHAMISFAKEEHSTKQEKGNSITIQESTFINFTCLSISESIEWYNLHKVFNKTVDNTHTEKRSINNATCVFVFAGER